MTNKDKFVTDILEQIDYIGAGLNFSSDDVIKKRIIVAKDMVRRYAAQSPQPNGENADKLYLSEEFEVYLRKIGRINKANEISALRAAQQQSSREGK